MAEERGKAVIRIGGMTCAMCVQALEEVIGKMPGVSSVQVNLATEKASVVYDPAKVTLPDMKKAIDELGYKYLGVASQVTEDMEKKALARDLREKMNRVIVGFAVSLPLMALIYVHMDVGLTMEQFSYLSLIVATPAFAYVSHPIFSAGYRAFIHRNLNMDVMYSMGIGVAFVSSVMGTFMIVLDREFMFYDTAIILAAFLMLGRYLETRAKGRTSEAIKKLIHLRPKEATVVRGGAEMQVLVEEVQIGDVVVVKPGERLPVDGLVVDGESYVDESMITGESVPNRKKAGSNVVGGTLNKNGVLRFEAKKVGKDTVLSQIIRMVEEAQGSKPPVQKLADAAVSWFIPVVLVIAILSFSVWYFLVGETLLFSLGILISILVVACPCALGLATPTAVTVGIGRGAELNILIRDGEALELSEKVTTVMFDKTGTLTKGMPEVTDVVPLGADEKDLLRLAASVEKGSQHPLAEAIVRKAEGSGISCVNVTSFDTFEGKGVSARLEGLDVVVGTRLLMSEKGVAIPDDMSPRMSTLESQGKTVVCVSSGSSLIGLIAIADPMKETSAMAVEQLKSMGVKVVMVTGDNRRTAEAIAKQVGITEVLAEVLPQDKAGAVKARQKAGETVAFVGDGINDAPALAQADVGIAIGSGTDVAIESGGIVLMRDDLVDAVGAIQLSRKVMTRIRQNLFWAFAYNTALIPVAAGLLHNLFGISFKPEFAGLAMALSSVTVVSLSLMLKGYTPPAKRGGGGR